MLRPIPIPRYRCKIHGCFSGLPPFLARYLRYLAGVVDQALQEYAGSQEPVCRVLSEDGPAVVTIGRWIRCLLDVALQPWLENEREQVPDRRPSSPQPPRSYRTSPWQILSLARAVARGWNSDFFSPFLQRARLASR